MQFTRNYKKIYNKVVKSEELRNNDKYYWGYQFRLGAEILVPDLSESGFFRPGFKTAEIGSAEGGALAAFELAGADKCYAVDIASDRLKIGRRINKIGGFDIEFERFDILKENPESDKVAAFDLIILRDVIEHLDKTRLALAKIKTLMKPGGYLFVTFPPYNSPFGGHQHTAANRLGKLPYIHLLPNFIFHRLIASGRPNDVWEIKRLQGIKLDPGKFLFAAEKTGLEVVREEYYLLRPVFKMKFGVPSMRITPLKNLPLVKSFLSLEANFVLRRPPDEPERPEIEAVKRR